MTEVLFARLDQAGPVGPKGDTGPQGIPGAVYQTTSAQAKTTAGSGSVSFSDVAAGLAWTAGARGRVTSRGTLEFMEGVCSSYTGTTLAFTMDLNSGTGSHSDWDINIAGQQGTQGPQGLPGTGTISGGVAHGVAFTSSASAITTNTVLGNAEILVGQTGADALNKAVGGDLTMDNLGAFTIGATKVTYAKIQNVSATARVLGRITAGAGPTEELTGANVVTIIGGNVATLQAPGNWKVFYSDGSGVVTALTTGALGTSLSGAGVTSPPTFAAWATTAQYWANSANAILATNNVWTAAVPGSIADSATYTPDLSANIDIVVTLGATCGTTGTFANPTSPKAGQKGVIYFVQDGTGGRKIATGNWGTQYKFPGGSKPTFSTAASAIDTMSYTCKSTTEIHCFFTPGMS